MKRHKTTYPGVFYREAERVGGNGLERIYYIVFKQGGKVFKEKGGRQYAGDMTPARPARIEAERIERRRQSRKEVREAARLLSGLATGSGKSTMRAGGPAPVSKTFFLCQFIVWFYILIRREKRARL